MSQPGIEPGPPAWEASTLEKSQSDSGGNCDSEHFNIWARDSTINIERDYRIRFGRQLYAVYHSVYFIKYYI